MKKIASSAVFIGIFFHSICLFALPPIAFSRNVAIENTAAAYSYKIIQAPNNTWGYNILEGNKIFIHQPNRPGLPGTVGFQHKKDAIIVAKLVIAKLEKGEMPPTISIEELHKMKLIE